MLSMTGFGSAEHATDHFLARVEISSVNRKQADIVFNLSRDLAEAENSLRKLILAKISRGRIHVSIHLEVINQKSDTLKLNVQGAQALENAFIELSELLNRKIEPHANDFLKAPGVFDFKDTGYDTELAVAAINPALVLALDKLIEMRAREGDDLQADLLQRLDLLEREAEAIKEKSPLVVIRQRELLHQRLRDAEIDLDLHDERLLKEIALFSERCDITEETTRLASHFTRFRETLALDEPIGRTLDFMCQELNRELNTIGSKANNSEIAQHVVSSKTELEKIREQVQNIE